MSEAKMPDIRTVDLDAPWSAAHENLMSVLLVKYETERTKLDATIKQVHPNIVMMGNMMREVRNAWTTNATEMRAWLDQFVAVRQPMHYIDKFYPIKGISHENKQRILGGLIEHAGAVRAALLPFDKPPADAGKS